MPVGVSRSKPRSVFYAVLIVASVVFSLFGVPPQPAQAAPPTEPGTFVSVDPSRLLDTREGNGGYAVPGYGTLSLQVTGRGSIPATGVAAITMNVTVVNPVNPGFITVYPSGSSQPTASNLNFKSGQTIPNLVTVKVGADGKVNLTNNSGGMVHLLADAAGYYLSGTPTVPGAFASLDPSRLLDTRVGNGAAGPVSSFGTVNLQVTGRGGVPADGVAAVVMNVTVTGSASAGFITVYPGGTSQPTASNLNFTSGQDIPNQVTVKVGAGGQVSLTNNSNGTAHLIADVAGYYLTGAATVPGAFVSLDPSRLLDTRVGNGAAQSPVTPGGTVGLQVNGRGGVPASGVSAVVANVTVTSPTWAGFITVYPSSTGQPTASNLNFAAGQTIPNLTTVKVGADGKIAPTNNSGGTVDLIADVAGYFLGDPAERGYWAAAQRIANGLPVASVGSASTTLNQLTVATPGSMTGYSRDLFPHWRDATNNGWPPVPNPYCDGRQATLYRDGTGVAYDSACTISSGTWFDPYSATSLYAASDVDIDHVVPLADAWRSGAAGWTTAQRTGFANDGLVLLAADDGVNQSKGDKGPDLWKPPNQAAHCLYAKRWIAIKAKYALTVSPNEKAALEQMLGTCQS